jgi:CheY-like chemotaxis protein
LGSSAQTEGRVLVVDDDEIVVAALEEILEAEGFAVTTRSSPIGVTKVILEQRIDVVVLDINMPVLRGDSVVRLLRSWDKLRDVPIVIVSGLEDDALAEIQRDFPDAPVVRKDAMRKTLAATVRVVYKTRVNSSRRQRSPTDSARVTSSFLEHLSRSMTAFRGHWINYATSPRREVLLEAQLGLKSLVQQAQLIGLGEVAQLLSHLDDITRSVVSGAPVTPAINHAMLTTTGALQDAAAHPEGKMPVTARALVNGLSKGSG